MIFLSRYLLLTPPWLYIILLNYYIKIFNSAVDKHAPFKKLRITNGSNPWFTADIADMLHSRDISWNKARTSGLGADWQHFHHLRNKCLVAIRNAKSFCYVSSLSDCYGNPAKFWRIIKSLSHSPSSSLPNQITQDSVTVSKEKELCDIFNKHFVTAGHLFENSPLIVLISDKSSSMPGNPGMHSAQCSLSPLGLTNWILVFYD